MKLRIPINPRKLKDNERSTETHKDVIDLYYLWYDKYTTILRFIIIVALGVFSLSSGFIFDQLLNPDSPSLNLFHVQVGMAIIFLAAILAFIGIAATYRWLIAILERTFHLSTEDYNEAFGDRRSSKDRSTKKEIRRWDDINFYTGSASGFVLLVGLTYYGLAIWSLMQDLH